MSPPSNGWIPATDLITVLLPAPLSPTRAVTCPAYVSRSTPRSTCTAPKLLFTPRRDSTGCPCVATFSVGEVAAAAMVVLGAGDPGVGARLLQGSAGADVAGGDE